MKRLCANDFGLVTSYVMTVAVTRGTKSEVNGMAGYIIHGLCSVLERCHKTVFCKYFSILNDCCICNVRKWNFENDIILENNSSLCTVYIDHKHSTYFFLFLITSLSTSQTEVLKCFSVWIFSAVDIVRHLCHAESISSSSCSYPSCLPLFTVFSLLANASENRSFSTVQYSRQTMWNICEQTTWPLVVVASFVRGNYSISALKSSNLRPVDYGLELGLEHMNYDASHGRITWS